MRKFIKAIALSAVLMVSTTTIAKAQPSQQDNLKLTPRQNLYCESNQFSYPSKPLGKQIKVSTRCVEGQTKDNKAPQSQICSVYFDEYKAVTENKFQFSRVSCFAPKPLKDSSNREFKNSK